MTALSPLRAALALTIEDTDMPTPRVPSADELNAQRQAATPPTTPTLPAQWTAQVLLTPFGDATPAMPTYSQLVVANVQCDTTSGAMLVDLYLTNDLTYYSFFFVQNAWFWLERTPGGPVTASFGPFYTSLAMPQTTFFSDFSAQFGNTYPINGMTADHWVVPTDPTHGSWYAINEASGYPCRIFTFDSDNPCRIPILGSYYIANIPTMTPSVDSPSFAAAMAATTGAKAENDPVPGYSNPLVTQEDIQAALASPLTSAPCTLAQIQALIPGFTPNPSGVTIPVWTNQTYITGMTIGTDFIPYATFVYYDYDIKLQQSIFIGLGTSVGMGSYDQRQDCCLSATQTDIPQYYSQNGAWVANCCDGTIPNVGIPRPDWLSADGGVVVAQIAGNADFGLQPNEVLNIFNCPLDRGPGELALFWVWFKGDGTGVLFTEGNYMKPTDHSLQLIDYTTFQQNATWIDSSNFSDPCPSLSACSAVPTAAARLKTARRVFGPKSVTVPAPDYSPTRPAAVPSSR